MLTPELQKIADYIISDGTKNTSQGNWIIYFDEFPDELGGEEYIRENKDAIKQLLEANSEVVADVYVSDDSFDVCYYLAYCPNAERDEVEDNPIPDYEALIAVCDSRIRLTPLEYPPHD